jgi:predicted dehydrogenase
MSNRPLRGGIIGGGTGFIGIVHRMAAELDGQARIVAGALSRDPKTARDSAATWGLQRSYESFAVMARAESAMTDGIDFVIVATPNDSHAEIVATFLKHGIHVICDKPLAMTVTEATTLGELARNLGRVLALTHNYVGYPMVRAARQIVRSGMLGQIRKVHVEYLQDWLMTSVETAGNKQAAWRVDPARSGISCCVADIGTHAENLLSYVTDLRIDSLCADLTSFVAGRRLDDDANMLLRFKDGARGTLICSQVACGEENNLTLRIYGSQASLEWTQEDPNTLWLKPAGQFWQRVRSGHALTGVHAMGATRLPPGHPEGYVEAFANVYRDAIADMLRLAAGEPAAGGYPSAEDGIRSLRFVESAVRSSQLGAVWIAI